MAKYKLLLPKMGESVAEATIIKWVKNPGDYIDTDETVIEIATDKVDSDVPSPVSGKLIEQFYKENDVVQVGDVVAIIETDEADEPEIGTNLAAAVSDEHTLAIEKTQESSSPQVSDADNTPPEEIKQTVFAEQLK